MRDASETRPRRNAFTPVEVHAYADRIVPAQDQQRRARPSGENHRREKESTSGRLLPPKQPTEHVELEPSDVVMASGGDGSEQARTH